MIYYKRKIMLKMKITPDNTYYSESDGSIDNGVGNEWKRIVVDRKIFGKWQVLIACASTEKGERRWLCRCECSTERPVLERSLKSGGSGDCGCGRRNRASQNNRYSMEGQVFGDLTVIGVSQN